MILYVLIFVYVVVGVCVYYAMQYVIIMHCFF